MEQYVHLMPLGPEKRTFILGTNGTIVIRKSPPPARPLQMAILVNSFLKKGY